MASRSDYNTSRELYMAKYLLRFAQATQSYEFNRATERLPQNKPIGIGSNNIIDSHAGLFGIGECGICIHLTSTLTCALYPMS